MTKNQHELLNGKFEDDIDYITEYKILEITEQICEIMEKKAINRAALSEIMDTSKAAITKMLNGNTNFTLKRLLKVAISLDKELNICFKEPKKAIDFNDSQLSPTFKIDTVCNEWGSFNEIMSTNDSQHQPEEPIAA